MPAPSSTSFTVIRDPVKNFTFSVSTLPDPGPDPFDFALLIWVWIPHRGKMLDPDL
jgi:hypothetical protein